MFQRYREKHPVAVSQPKGRNTNYSKKEEIVYDHLAYPGIALVLSMSSVSRGKGSIGEQANTSLSKDVTRSRKRALEAPEHVQRKTHPKLNCRRHRPRRTGLAKSTSPTFRVVSTQRRNYSTQKESQCL
jgi:hypothetical protein